MIHEPQALIKIGQPFAWRGPGHRKDDVSPLIVPATILIDFSDLTSFTKDGTNIITALTEKGSSNSFAPVATGPTFVAAAQNGLGVGRFTTAGNDLSCASLVGLANGSAAQTMFFVSKFNTTTATQYGFELSNDGLTNRTNFGITAAVTASYRSQNLVSTTVAIDTAWHVFSATRTLSSSQIYKDGVAGTAGSGGAEGSAVVPNGMKIGIGFQITGPMGGDIGEIRLFNRVLTTTERQAIEAALKVKWGTP